MDPAAAFDRASRVYLAPVYFKDNDPIPADGRLSIEIKDNGLGISPERLAEVYGGGIGISNVHERLRLLYGDQFKMDIQSLEGQGTQIYIEIPEVSAVEPAAN